MLSVLDVVLPPPSPQSKDLRPQRLAISTRWGACAMLVVENARNLYSGKHHRAEHNL